MDIQATKLELIKIIADSESERLLQGFKDYWKQFRRENGAGSSKSKVSYPPASEPSDKVEEPEWVAIARQPMPDFISLDELALRQNYDGKKVSQALAQWDYSLFEDQSLEELLNSLTK